jgi:alkylation response protein AidB-like acyl-CoA dehydrogenase
MSLLLNEEQRMLADSARGFLAERSPVAALRALRDRRDALGHDPGLWQEMAALGWPAAALPEAHGGLGFGWQGLGAVFEQLGRHLTATPMLSTTVLGGGLLERCGSPEQQAHWLPRIAAGQALLALAIDETPRHDPLRTALSASPADDGGWRLQGRKQFVLDGHIAQALLVLARTSGEPGQAEGLSLFLVDAAAHGVHVQRHWLLDSRNAASVQFDAVLLRGAARLGPVHGAFDPLDAVLDRARACLAAEALGVAGEAFERTIGYLKQRVQFDVPIGSFQALQHRAARLHVALELTRSAVAAAFEALDAGAPDAAQLASLAKAKASDLGTLVCNEAVQMHGGIGVTDELDIGLFLKRARVLQQTFGDAGFHRDRYARLAGF